MINEVIPKTFLIGYTTLDDEGMKDYLWYTGNQSFWEEILKARVDGISDGEILCSYYAKLCYKALKVGDNPNITRTRGIEGNLQACFNAGHGSVFEHCVLNFVTTNCSRIFTHELVRHRAGTAFSQTSGRYVRLKEIDMVIDPILEPVMGEVELLVGTVERAYERMEEKLGLSNMTDFAMKKKYTSALRRIAPNGQANEIGWSMNLRAIRHTIMMRTSRGAEWEIRKVFHDVYELLDQRFPLLFYGAKVETVNGLFEVSGMKAQPYEEDKT